MKLKKFYKQSIIIKLNILILISFLSGCSFSNSKFWTESEKIDTGPAKETLLFVKSGNKSFELNPNLKILINNSGKVYSYSKNKTNIINRYNFDYNLQTISKLRLAKNKNFFLFDYDIDYHKNGFIFFDSKGSILNFDKSSEILWKKNYYTKKEKKLLPYLFISNNEKFLVAADDLAKLYLINLQNGNLVWSKNNSSPFNSDIKFYKDRFFVVDSENILRCYSIKSGEEIWNLKTEKLIIRSKKSLSIAIYKNLVFFNNTLGDISAVDVETGQLKWQISTQTSEIYSNSHSFEMSDLVIQNEKIYTSSNRGEFYSISTNDGVINWKQSISSKLTPIILENYILTITTDGYFSVIEKASGNLIRNTFIFNMFKEKKRKKIFATGFTIGNKNLYVTTNNGKLIVLDISSGKILTYYGFGKNKISNPRMIHKNLYLVSGNSIIKID